MTIEDYEHCLKQINANMLSDYKGDVATLKVELEKILKILGLHKNIKD